MLHEILDEYISKYTSPIPYIILSPQQGDLLLKEMLVKSDFGDVSGSKPETIVTYRGVPILIDSENTNFKCKFCDKNAVFEIYEGRIIGACPEHIDKARMFHLLSLRGKK